MMAEESETSLLSETVAEVAAAMQLGGVYTPPLRSGDRWFSVELKEDGSGERMLVLEEDGVRRTLLDPIRHNAIDGPSRGGWVVGPRGADGEQYVVVNDFGERESDAGTAGVIIDVRTGERVHEIEPRVMGIGFVSPTKFIYEKLLVHMGHATLPDGTQRIPLRTYDIATGVDAPFAMEGVDYDDNSPQGFVRSPDGRWLVIVEVNYIFGLGNRSYLLDLQEDRAYVHGADRAAIVHPAFASDQSLLLESDGEIRRVDLGDPSPDAVRHALEAPEVLMAAQDGVLVERVLPFDVDGRQALAISRQVKGAYSELVILDPAAEAPQVVDLASQIGAWPMLDGDSDRVLGPQGSLEGLALGQDGRPVFTFSGTLNPLDFYTLDYRGPSQPAVVERQTTNREKLAERLAVPELVGRLYEAVAKDGHRVPYHTVSRADAERKPPGPTGLFVYGHGNIVMTRGFTSLLDKAEAQLIIGGGTRVHAAHRGSGELGGPNFRAGQWENDEVRVTDNVAVVRDMIRRGIAEAKQVVLFGGSASGPPLVQIFEKARELFAGVFAVNPATSLDPDRNPEKARQHNRMITYGNPGIPEERRRLKHIDPLNRVLAIIRGGGNFSLGLVQGTKDDRVLPAGVRELAERTQEAIDQGIITGTVALTELAAGHHISNANLSQIAQQAFVDFFRRVTGWNPRALLQQALDSAPGRDTTQSPRKDPEPDLSTAKDPRTVEPVLKLVAATLRGFVSKASGRRASEAPDRSVAQPPKVSLEKAVSLKKGRALG